MNENDVITMSRIAFERMQAKDERNDKWRNIIILVLIVLLVATNAMWLWYEMQFTTVDEYDVELDSGEGGNANYIGNNGDIHNGEGESNEEENQNS